ncbi:prolyl 4-hydroxylase subunit alpha-2-like [Drosophila biarmipes]|uniref:prolyl 4-hydroxylase subunit alpha-2-like n=1 Tax=Drosophila biarmipes TaxID=125945 RepID=UPI001CDA95BD|nr:prolyl 4-hydroxylase subunit alpha-2-like [Drosophila biarmipes]
MLRTCALICLLYGVALSFERQVKLSRVSHGYALSHAHLMPLLSLKEEVTGNLRNYATVLTKRLTQVKLAIKHVENLVRSKQSQNALVTFKEIREFYYDWGKWLTFLKEKHGHKEISKLKSLRNSMPTKIDHDEALYGIHRLQTTYKLDPAELSNGLIKGKQYKYKKFNAADCLMTGSVFYLNENFQDAERWFQMALEKYYNDPNSKQFDIFGWSEDFILKLLMKAAQSSGRYKAALEYAEKALVIDRSRTFWQQQIPRLKNLSSSPEYPKPEKVDEYLFKPACRMEYPAKKYLRCHLLFSSPFLKLAPIKVEELNLDPPINIYHNLINNEEIVLLKALSTPHLKRSLFYSETNLVIEDFSNLRTCKTVRLKDSDHHSLMKKLNQRITDATSLSVVQSEDLQISNYGIAGHLYEHQDSGKSPEGTFWVSGNRVITALYYLSDVELGGETVFPFLDLRVRTQKGSLLVWYNLLLNGTSDWRVRHASCPILKGDKWIATKWLRESPQMFIRPCPLKVKPLADYSDNTFKNKFS